MQNILHVHVIWVFSYRVVIGGPPRGGNMQPAPSKQCCTIDRLCRTSSLCEKVDISFTTNCEHRTFSSYRISHDFRRKFNCFVRASTCNNNVPVLSFICMCSYYQHIIKFIRPYKDSSHKCIPQESKYLFISLWHMASDLLMFCSPWAYLCRRCSSGWSRRSKI